MSAETKALADEIFGTFQPKLEALLQRGVPLSNIGGILMGITLGCLADAGATKEQALELTSKMIHAMYDKHRVEPSPAPSAPR